MRRRLALVPLSAIAAVALAGCVSVTVAGGTGGATQGVVPPTSATPSDGDASAAWLDGGRVIAVVTSGSSTCVPVPSDAVVEAGRITVTLTDPDTDCTRDFVPRATLFPTPAGIDPARDVDIELAGDYTGDADLDGVAGLSSSGETDYQPSAGWTGEDDQLVILTWGSSGCPPVVESVAVDGPAALTVTFQTPPADQVCTADIAPRAVVVVADGLEDDVTAQLTLAGGADFDPPVTFPVYGTP